jgi:DNA-binding CsgD family transcriptional regulator
MTDNVQKPAGRSPIEADRRKVDNVLVGRALELERLGALLDEARLGHAGAIVVAGEPGVGKTSILDATVARAGDFQVLRARGIESECALTYAVLVELLGGTPSLLDWLPARRRAALEAACRLQPLDDGAAVVAAWTSLLTSLAERRPVLVVVDDVQWIDQDSADAIFFAARRVGDARIATVFALREPHASTLVVDGIERVEVSPLDEASARMLAAGASPDVLAAAAGNPLALVEMARHGATEAHASTVAERLFGHRIRELTASARSALLAASLDRSGRADVVAAVAGEQAIDELRGHALVDVHDNALELRHPLLRTLMLATAPADERRAVHAALAAALPAGMERTRHRALAATGPDAGLADELEKLAVRTGGSATRAWAFERAAELTPSASLRASRLLDAALVSFAIRDVDKARRLALRAREEDVPATRSGLGELDARLALLDGAELEGARALRAVAAESAAHDPARAARLFVVAAYVLAGHGRVTEALEIVAHASTLAGDDPVLRLLISSAHAEAIGAAGDYVRAQQLFADAAAKADCFPATHADTEARLVLVEAFFSGAQLDRARQVAATAVRDARAAGALGELRLALACMFSIEFGAGRWDAADAAAFEELELAAGLGRTMERREALGHLAWCDAVKGRVAACRDHIRERQALSGVAGANVALHPALGLLELGLGEFEQAAVFLEASERAPAAIGRMPAATLRPCTADLVEALVRAGRNDDAGVVLDGFERDAQSIGRPLALSLVHRARGILVEGGEFDAEFERSLELDLDEPWPFERARTQLCWGERLRRERRRAEARVPLRQARDAFERAGATLWLARAEAELAATGERVRKRGAGSGGELTPQEHRVASLVTEGLTNREVADRLFVSTNTIESHLRHLFQKVGVRSRTELAARFTDLRDSNGH